MKTIFKFVQSLTLLILLVGCSAKQENVVRINLGGEPQALDPRKARVVELRFFGGMNVEETAEVMGIHANTVIRDWSAARAWLIP